MFSDMYREMIDPDTGQLKSDYFDWNAVSNLIHAGNESTRAQALRTVARYGTNAVEALEAVLDCLNDPNPAIAKTACAAVGTIGPLAGSGIPLLIERATAGPDTVREEALEALGRIGAGDADSVLPVLRNALRDPNGAVRRSALIGLRSMGPAAAPAIPALIAALDDKWPPYKGGWDDWTNNLIAAQALEAISHPH